MEIPTLRPYSYLLRNFLFLLYHFELFTGFLYQAAQKLFTITREFNLWVLLALNLVFDVAIHIFQKEVLIEFFIGVKGA